MKKAKSSKTVIMAAFSANLLIALVKFAVAWLSASSAMLAEAIHSTADTLNQVLLFVGIKKAARKADELHPFGFSGEAYFWSFIVAIILFTSGAIFSIYEGVQKLRHPAPVAHLPVALAVLGIAIIASVYLICRFRSVPDLSAIVVIGVGLIAGITLYGVPPVSLIPPPQLWNWPLTLKASSTRRVGFGTFNLKKSVERCSTRVSPIPASIPRRSIN